ncbi:MAG: bifunctional acetate--CoA ligase family protein/GNAT family N-acetyltransferase [Syntrophorhabdales bacterium]
MGDIGKMFHPKTVALFGATDEEKAVGRIILTNLLFSGSHRSFPVNPHRETVLDVTCYPNIAAIGEKIDLAVIATPAPTVPAILEDCGNAGVEGIVIVTDFIELGDEGRRLEEEIKEISKPHGMRILGPNSIGIIRPHIGLNASVLETQLEKGNVAFISQSASIGSVVIDRATATNVGFSTFVSLGSMIDIDFGELIDFLGEDPGTRSIMMYMETIGNARRFMSAARRFARNKPIIVVKSGQFKESAKASLSHTGSMAGYDAAYDVAFKRAGVVRVREISHLFNAAEVLHSKHLPSGPRLAIVTNAGGPGVVATDVLISLGGKLAKLSKESTDRLNAFLPRAGSESNPLDLLRSADVDRYIRTIDVCMKDQEVDGILIIYAPQNTVGPVELAEAVAAIAREAYKPVIAAWMGTKAVRDGRDILTRNNIPNYQTPEEAIRTYLYMYSYGRNLQLLYETPAELPVNLAPPKNHLKAFIRRTLREERSVLSEEESKDFLVNYGIRCTIPFLTSGIESAINWANNNGYPVVIKIVSPDVIHRTEVGGMATGIYSENKLRTEYGALLARVRNNLPDATIVGVTVERMIENIDYELILGTMKDKDFGSVILFGRGGQGTEVVKDFSIGIPPLNQTLARLTMEETSVYKMLRGVRGKAPADLRELEQIINSFSNLIVDFPEIAEADINPIAIAQGRAYAVNTRIVLEKNSIEPGVQYPNLVITPYPSRYISHSTLSDGTDILLRPIRPEDEPLEHELLASLSEATMRARFFSIIKDISHEMLVRYCNIDYDREIAIVAEVREKEKRKLIGIGRLIIDRDFKSGEYAVLVHDDYQGKGLGYKLVDVLIGIAEEKGLERIYGEVLTENEKMLAVCRRLGFTAEWTPDDVTRVTLKLK